MELRKSRTKKEDPTRHSSRLFGIIDSARHINHRKNNASSRYYLNCEAEKTVKDATLEAEYRKAQSLTLARQNGMNM